MLDLVVIGGGPAGMMAAATAAHKGFHVVLLEKMERVGRKLGITGKGRCNLTNLKSWETFSEHVYPNARFFKPAFYHFSSENTVQLFQSLGLETVLERGDRVFPACGRASAVIDTLQKWLRSEGVQVQCFSQVTGCDFVQADASPNAGMKHIQAVRWVAQDGSSHTLPCDHVILATGGCSYPTTGSTGDGYAIARELGHSLVDVFPSLTALMPKEYDRTLEGIQLKNVGLDLFTEGVWRSGEQGEVYFTSLGIEGPLGLRLSRQAVVALRKGQRVELVLNLKPALTREQLQLREQREGAVATHLRSYMPSDLVTPFTNYCKKRRCSQIDALLQWRFPIESYGGWERAVVTSGGVSLSEIQAKTLRSRLVDNLSFAGEIMDLDADTGGYNLQIAFSTGRLAADTL